MVGKLSGYTPIKGSQSSYMTGRTSIASKRAQRLDIYHHRSGVYKARQQQNPMGLFGAIRGLISTVGDFFKTLFGGRKKTTSTNTNTTTTNNNNRDNSAITNPDNNTHTDKTDTREVDRADDGGGKGGGDDTTTETVPTFANAQVHDKAKERKNNSGKALTENNPNGNVQFVTGAVSDVVPTDDAGNKNWEKPKSFKITDSSNGPAHTYTYELFDPKKCKQVGANFLYDIGNGKTVQLTKEQKELAEKGQYILISCQDSKNGDLLVASHAECYNIEVTKGDNNQYTYMLNQDGKDAGAGNSSMFYQDRAKR